MYSLSITILLAQTYCYLWNVQAVYYNTTCSDILLSLKWTGCLLQYYLLSLYWLLIIIILGHSLTLLYILCCPCLCCHSFFCDIMWSCGVEAYLGRFFSGSFIYVLLLKIIINPCTCLCLSQVRTYFSKLSWSCSVSWGEMWLFVLLILVELLTITV